jgi:RimJ/RimL family protein N-acetyltransferase
LDVRLNPAGPVQREPGPHVGYWLGKPYWGRGYMTEAVRALLDRVFAADIGETVYSGVFTGNPASLRVQKKIGFAIDGENTLYSHPQGAELPHVSTVLTRSAFAAACARDGAQGENATA